MAQYTDNGVNLTNLQTGRTLFNLSHTIKTTSRFGCVDPTLCKFVLPNDTVQNKTQTYIELKPTVDKLNSTIISQLSSYFVPLRKVWPFFDQFLTKGNHYVRNGALNMPKLIKDNESSVTTLPCFDPSKIFGYLLASMQSFKGGVTNLNARLSDVDGNFGNVTSWDFDFIDENGKHYNSFRNKFNSESSSSIVSCLEYLPFWLPRLLGDGISQNGFYNLNYHFLNSQYNFTLHCTKPEFVSLFNYLHKLEKSDAPNYTCVNIEFRADNDNNCTSFFIYGSNDNFSIISSDTSNTTIEVNYDTDEYGLISFHNISPSTTHLCKYANAYIILLNVLFNHNLMFGKGSLTESLGVPFFKYVNFAQYSGTDGKVSSDFYGWMPIYGQNLVVGTQQNICILPYLSYQSIISDKFLLPHDVLSNNMQQDSTLSEKKFDSPIYRNNLIPTHIYENNTIYLDDVFEGSFLADGSINHGPNSLNVPTERYQHAFKLNQLLTVFLSRAGLIDTDFYTRMWQKENHLVQNVESASGYNVVDSDQRLNVKKMLLAKRLSKYIRFGGKDLTAEDFIEQHYGVKGVERCEDALIYLGSDTKYIQVSDVINTGGATKDGQPMDLGAKASVASVDQGNRNFFEYYSKTYGFIIQLHQLQVANEYFDVKNLDITKLTSTGPGAYAKRENFDTAFLPEFQDCGDDPLFDTDFDGVGSPAIIGWVNKNFFLKDSPNIVRGDYNDLYRRQIISPCDPNLNREQLSLTYTYLQKSPHFFTSIFQERTGDSCLLNLKQDCYRKSSMTKMNSVGLDV